MVSSYGAIHQVAATFMHPLQQLQIPPKILIPLVKSITLSIQTLPPQGFSNKFKIEGDKIGHGRLCYCLGIRATEEFCLTFS